MPIQMQHPAPAASSGSAEGGLVGDPVLRLTRYTSFEDAKFLREQWDEFVERIDGDLFAAFDWCATWWRYFGQRRQLELYVATAGNEMVAILPLFRDTIRWGPLYLRVIRIVGCDHGVTTCNVMIDPNWLESVVGALMVELNRGGMWDIIHLGELPGYFQHGRELADALRSCPESGGVVLGDSDYPHTVFDLPNTFDDYLASLSLKERRNVRRDERQLEGMGSIERHEPANPRELQQAFTELMDLHTSHWAKLGRLGHFGEWPNAEAFQWEVAQALLEHGRLALVQIRVNGKLQAAEYGGRFGRRLHWIIAARRHDTTSRIGFCALVRSALRRGVTQIDALPGYYDYKRRLGARVLGVKTITVLSPRLPSRVRARLFWATTWMIDLAYHRIWFWRVAPWLRKRFPSLRKGMLRAGLWRRYVRSRFLVAAKPKWHESAISAEVTA